MNKDNSARRTEMRRQVLKRLVTEKHFSEQRKLLKALKEEGFEITQPTLSKDLAKENIIFDKEENRYRFSDAPPKDILEKNLGDFYKNYAPTEPKKIVADLKICALNIKVGYADALAAEIKKYITDGRKPYYVQFLPMGDTLVVLYNDDNFIKELARVLDIQA